MALPVLFERLGRGQPGFQSLLAPAASDFHRGRQSSRISRLEPSPRRRRLGRYLVNRPHFLWVAQGPSTTACRTGPARAPEVRRPGTGGRARIERGPQLADMRCAGQDRKFSIQPGTDDSGGPASWSDQGGDDDVGIENHAHQALSAFRLARHSARTSLTASSTMRWISSGSASVLRALLSQMVHRSTRQRTASSMNFERSPFFMPWAPRNLRRSRSVSF